jgi:hypothetical protein
MEMEGNGYVLIQALLWNFKEYGRNMLCPNRALLWNL